VFHAPLISSVEGLELAAVMERTSDRAKERYPGVTVYHSLEDMLADSSLGLFVVTTPNVTHYPLARQILQAGKNVVVDKPTGADSSEIAELIQLAAAQKLLLAPFHNRRWDSDFLTVQKLLHEGSLGRLVSFESRFDRWRPTPPTDKPWKDNPRSGGFLLDLGTHLLDQALHLFGKPESVGAEVRQERDGVHANDSFTVRLHYPGLVVTLGSNALTLPPGIRFHLRGTQGNYWKTGLDSQEAELAKVARITDPSWGHEPQSTWGTLHVDIGGGTVTRPVPSLTGDYRLYYAGVRDALLGKAPAPVSALDAWRVSRISEWALESSEQRRQIICDWGDEPQ
jgi:predicted dehydrogenase